jgi:O-antigen/teichoic acid export membrane protein
MLILIWGGALLSLFGLIGLLFSMYKVAKAKKNNTSDQELRDSIKAAMPLNLASLFVSVLGLISVIIGVLMS